MSDIPRKWYRRPHAVVALCTGICVVVRGIFVACGNPEAAWGAAACFGGLAVFSLVLLFTVEDSQ